MIAYRFPWDRFALLALALPLGRRSITHDCRVMVARMSPPPAVHGEQNIPTSGPLVVAANHFQRRGLWIGWPGAVLTDTIARRRGPDPPLHWLVTGGVRFQQSVGQGAEIPGIAPIFQRVATTYQMAALPLSDLQRRAAALQRWLRWATQGEALGIFPEGAAGTTSGLRPPEPGFAQLAQLLARRSIPVLPVGIYDADGALHIRIGQPVLLSGAPTEVDPDDMVMRAIAALLPEPLRGSYHSAPKPITQESN